MFQEGERLWYTGLRSRQNLLLDWDRRATQKSEWYYFHRENILAIVRTGLVRLPVRCVQLAVVFAEDEDAGIRRKALDNPTHFGTAVRDVIRHKSVYSYIFCAECHLLSTECSSLEFYTRWVYNYQAINRKNRARSCQHAVFRDRGG